jgi:hypothetical protein
MKKIRGCGVEGMAASLLGKQRVSTCPRYFAFSEPYTLQKIARAHNMMEKGFLPEAGGSEDQSALLMEAVNIYASGIAEAREEQRPKGKGGK